MIEFPGTVPITIRCKCLDRRVPLHVFRTLLDLLASARVPPDFLVAKHVCTRCRVITIVRAADLPKIRLAS